MIDGALHAQMMDIKPINSSVIAPEIVDPKNPKHTSSDTESVVLMERINVILAKINQKINQDEYISPEDGQRDLDGLQQIYMKIHEWFANNPEQLEIAKKDILEMNAKLKAYLGRKLGRASREYKSELFKKAGIL
jgi:hypothetical protein